MDLGLDFDDSDFADKKKKKEVLTSYNAKTCHEKWFFDEGADSAENNDPATVHKFKADYHYFHGDMTAAIKAYQTTLEYLGSQNRTMRREVNESLIRCHIQTGDFTTALEDMNKLVCDCVTVDHYVQALMLKQQLYQAAGQLKEELSVLHQLVTLHPMNASLWLSLAAVYSRVISCKSLSCVPDRGHNVTCQCQQEKDRFQGPSNEVVKETSKEGSVQCSGCDGTTDSIYGQNSSAASLKTSQSSDKSGTSYKKDNCELSDDLRNLSLKHDEGEVCDKQTVTMSKVSSIGGVSALVNGYQLELVLLTCYVRARLILKATQGTVGSFIKERNERLITQTSNKIQSLQVSEEQISAAEQFMRHGMYDDDREDSQEQSADIKTLLANSIPVEEFNERWFGWATVNTSPHSQHL